MLILPMFLFTFEIVGTVVLSEFSVGGGTLASMPVIETLVNDLAAYIATNVISITDGQLVVDSQLFGIGVCPAVSVDRSVSRVGAKSLDPFSDH